MKTQTEIKNSELPPGWRWVRLGEVCEMITDGTHRTPYYVKEGVPFLSVKNVRESGLDFENVQYISEEEHKDLIKRCYPKKGDVLYTKVGTTGIAKAIDTDKEFSIFVSVALLRPNRTTVIPEYLEKVLNSPFCKEQAKALTQGVGNQNLVIKDLKRIEFPLAPLPEQTRIASKLQELMQEIYNLKSAINNQLEAAKALPSAYLREVFESEDAKKWERKRLGEVCEKIIGGGTPSRGNPNYWGGPIYWLSPSELYEDKLNYVTQTKEKITDAGSKNSNAKIIPPKSVLLSCTASVGKVGINEVLLTTNQQFNSFVLKDTITVPEFIAYYLLYRKEDIKQLGGKTTFTFISKDEIGDLLLPLAPLPIQRRIASYLKEKMAQVDNLQSAILNQKSAINALPQVILKKAFRGEL